MPASARRSSILATALATLAVATPSCRGGCTRRTAPVPAPADLDLVPAGARFLLSIDFARIRGTATWQRLTELSTQDPADKRTIDEFVRRTGFDPFRQIRSLVLAFPEDARTRGEFGMVVRGEGFDEKRLVAYAREQAGQGGGDIVASRRAGRILWSDDRESRTAAFFIDYRTLVVGGGGWTEKMADLSSHVLGAKSLASLGRASDLLGLARRAAGEPPRAVWGAAVVPAETRRQLLADPRFGSAASVARLAGSIDLTSGIRAELVAELSNAVDARAMADRVAAAVRQAKRDPKILVLGIAPMLDGVKARADGPSFSVTVTLDEARAADLVGRLKGLVEFAREGQRR